MPGSAQGSRKLRVVTAAELLWASQASQAAKKETTVSEGHSVLTNTLASSRPAQPSATGQTQAEGGRFFTSDLIERYE